MSDLYQSSLSYINCILKILEFEKQSPIILNIYRNALKNDFYNFQKNINSNVLLNHKYPLDISARFELAGTNSFRFTVEPLWYMEPDSRIVKIKKRFLNLLRICGLEENVKLFDDIFYTLIDCDHLKLIKWKFQFGFVINEFCEIILKFYVIPLPHKVIEYFGSPKSNGSNNNISWEEVMSDHKNCQNEVKERIIELFKMQGLHKEIEQFLQIYAAIAEDDDQVERKPHIAFIGVDFEKDKKPSFKIYFNPNFPK